MENLNLKKIHPIFYVLAGLTFIPLLGVCFALPLFIFGLVTKKQGGKTIAVVAIVGICFSIVLYGSLFYFGFVKRGGGYDDLRIKLAQSTLTDLVKTIEFHKLQHGNYPQSLLILKQSLPENSTVFINDATDAHVGQPSRYFYYQLIDENHYYLLSVGPDSKPFTADDILPDIGQFTQTKTGLLVKK